MADKPKKKRDLRARLGRTITPKTKGGGGPAAPPKAGGGGPVPPPSLGGEAEAAAPSSVTPPPAGVTPPPSGVAAPPPGIGGAGPAPGGVAPPPFAQQPAAPEAPADPFAASPTAQPAQPQVVRLEFDDKPVSDAEVGRKQRLKLVIIAAVVAVAGLGVGWGAGGMLERRAIYNRTVRDGQEIYQTVNEASQTITNAQRHIDAVVQSAAGNEATGDPPSVNYEAIEAIRALEKPFDASAFTTKNYGAFQPGTVNDLFTYMMNVQKLFEEFRSLVAMSLSETARAELDRTAEATAEGASTLYGAVMRRTDEEPSRLVGSLAFLTIEEQEGEQQVVARATRGGQGRPLDVFAGGEDQEIGTSPDYVMLIDGATSRGVLAEQTGAFGRFLQKIREIKTLLDQTVEIQGRLLQALGEVARLEEV